MDGIWFCFICLYRDWIIRVSFIHHFNLSVFHRCILESETIGTAASNNVTQSAPQLASSTTQTLSADSIATSVAAVSTGEENHPHVTRPPGLPSSSSAPESSSIPVPAAASSNAGKKVGRFSVGVVQEKSSSTGEYLVFFSVLSESCRKIFDN